MIISQLKSDKQSSGKGYLFQVSNSPDTKSIPPDIHQSIEETQLRWYLESYAIQDPFNRTRAEASAQYLSLYSDSLCQVALQGCELEPDLDGWTRIQIRSHEDSCLFHDLHWESLERWAPTQGALAVSREITVPDERKTTSTTIPIGDDGFNICLFVSRPEVMGQDGVTDTEHRLVSKPLVENFAEGDINTNIVRPGTFDALERHLEAMKQRGQQVHLVHFDVHGVIRKVKGKRTALLRFMDTDFTSELITAERIANTLLAYDVRVVVLTTCDSARSNAGEDGNFAKTLVRCGIDFVFAMSYKLMVSAVTRLTTAFYTALLMGKGDCTTAGAAARQALRNDTSRNGRFGLTVPVNDWIVPVSYCAEGVSISFRRTGKAPLVNPKHISIAGIEDQREQTKIVGREQLILQIESRMLLQRKILFLEGLGGWGKTTLAKYLSSWWTRTGLVSESFHIELDKWPVSTPLGVCQEIIDTAKRVVLKSGGELVTEIPPFQAKSGSPPNPDIWTQRLEKLQALLSAIAEVEGPPKLFILDGLVLSAPNGEFVRQNFRDNPHYIQWQDLFTTLRNWSGYVIMFSRLVRDFNDFDRPDILERIDLPKMSEYAAHQLLNNLITLQGGGGPGEIPNHESSRKIEAVERLLSHIECLPSCISILAQVLRDFEAPGIEERYVQSMNLSKWSDAAESILSGMSLYKHCAEMFPKLTDFEKNFLYGISLCTGALPKDLDGFIAHLLKHECFPSLIPEQLSNISCDCCRRQEWASKLLEYILSNETKELPEIMGEWWPRSWSIENLLLNLHQSGQIFISHAYVNWGAPGIPLPVEAFKVHPVFTMFLREKLQRLDSRSIQSYKSAFVDYYNWRCLPRQLWKAKSLDPRAFGEHIEQRLQDEISHCRENFLTAIDIAVSWVFEDMFPDGPPVSFPFIIFRSITTFEMRFGLHEKPLPLDTVSRYATKILHVFLEMGEYPPWNTKQSRSSDYGAISTHSKSTDRNRQTAYTLHSLLQVSNWLCGVFIVKEDVVNFDSHESISRKLAAEITNKFPEMQRVISTDMTDLELSKGIIYGTGLSKVYDLFGDGAVSGNVRRRPGKIFAEIKEMWQKHAMKMAAFGVSESDRTQSVNEYNQAYIMKLRELAPIWSDYLEAIRDDEETVMMLRFQGLRIANTEKEVGEDERFLEDIDQVMEEQIPGGGAMRLMMTTLVEAIEAIKSGASDEEVLRVSTRHNQTIIKSITSREAHLYWLEHYVQRGNLWGVKNVHHQLIQDYLQSEDWSGLRTHLDSLWVRERSLPIESLSDEEIQLLCSWWYFRGISAAGLSDHQYAVQELTTALEIALPRSPQLDDLQFRILIQLGVLRLNHQTGSLPAWSRLVRAGIIAYKGENRHIYARNGALLVDILRELQAFKQLQTEEVELNRIVRSEEFTSVTAHLRGLEVQATRPDGGDSQGLQRRTELVRETARVEHESGCFVLASLLDNDRPSLSWYDSCLTTARAVAQAQAPPGSMALVLKGKQLLSRLEESIEQTEGSADRTDLQNDEVRRILTSSERELFHHTDA